MNFYSFLFLLFLRLGTDIGGIFLVPIHGGIWTLCTKLNEHEIEIITLKGYPEGKEKCVSYLAGVDNSRTIGVDEPRADWQHSESQTSLNPHLSRYNENVFDFNFNFFHILNKRMFYLIFIQISLIKLMRNKTELIYFKYGLNF